VTNATTLEAARDAFRLTLAETRDACAAGEAFLAAAGIAPEASPPEPEPTNEPAAAPTPPSATNPYRRAGDPSARDLASLSLSELDALEETLPGVTERVIRAHAHDTAKESLLARNVRLARERVEAHSLIENDVAAQRDFAHEHAVEHFRRTAYQLHPVERAARAAELGITLD
jgi:hypothetical protein